MTDTRTPYGEDVGLQPQDRPPLEINVSTIGTYRRVTVRGDLDIATADQLATALTVLAAQDHPVVLLDLAELTFCDANGLNTLLAAHRAHEAADGSLILTRYSRQLARLLQLTGLDHVLITGHHHNPTPEPPTAPQP